MIDSMMAAQPVADTVSSGWHQREDEAAVKCSMMIGLAASEAKPVMMVVAKEVDFLVGPC